MTGARERPSRTGAAEIGRIRCGFASVCGLLFPGCVRAYYLTGSSADGTKRPVPIRQNGACVGFLATDEQDGQVCTTLGLAGT